MGFGHNHGELRATDAFMSPTDVTALRAALDLNPLQLADQLGVPPRLILQWEAGDRFPTRKHCQQMQEMRVRSEQLAAAAPRLEAGRSPDDPVTEIVHRLLADPTFARRLRDLVVDHLSSSSASDAPSSFQSSSGSSDTEVSTPSP